MSKLKKQQSQAPSVQGIEAHTNSPSTAAPTAEAAPVTADLPIDPTDTTQAIMNLSLDPTEVVGPAYPVSPTLDGLKMLLQAMVGTDSSEAAQSLRRTVEAIIQTILDDGGVEGLEEIICLYKQIEAIKKVREAQATPFLERYQSFKLLIDEDDQVRRFVQHQVIRWMAEHAEQFQDSQGKLRATTQSFKFSITEKNTRPLIINSTVLEAIARGNQRFDEIVVLSDAGDTDERSEPNPLVEATTKFFMALLNQLWVELPVPPEFLKLSVRVELDEAAVRQSLNAGEELDFATLGEPSRWLTFSGRGKSLN